MLCVIALNKEINALIGIEVVKGFCLGEVSMTGKSSYTEDVIVYPAPLYIPHKYPLQVYFPPISAKDQ
jgi:hypothetical protein